jgi:hypothetical protein
MSSSHPAATSVRAAPRAAATVVLGLLLAALAALLLSPAASPAASAAAGPAPRATTAQTQGSLCTGPGVNVVVDPQSLGGATTLACDTAGAGRTAAQVFADAGVEIIPVASFPGAACRVDGKPAQGGCAKMPPADAYWGLYVDKGTSWTYAPKGADELRMADGDFVAFSWQGTKTSTPPGVAPASPSASPSAAASASASDSPGSQDPQDPQDPQDKGGLGVGFWVPALVVLLLVAAAVVVLVRRRGRAGL